MIVFYTFYRMKSRLSIKKFVFSGLFGSFSEEYREILPAFQIARTVL